MSFDGRDIMNTEFDAAPIVTPPRSDADSQRTSVSPLTGQLLMASAAAARITVVLRDRILDLSGFVPAIASIEERHFDRARTWGAEQ
jgi:hypothetical protein